MNGRLETALLLWLNRFFRPPRLAVQVEEAAGKPREEWEAEEFLQSRDGFLRLKAQARLEGCVVLDLACGTGVKTTSYAAASPEARLVVGVDVDAAALQRGRSFSCQRGGTRVAFLRADAAALPFKDQSIDLVVSENAFEHVPDPGTTLREVGRVLKRRGVLSLRFFPMYYSPYGSHLWDFLSVPWAHVWASGKAVTAAYRRIVEAETTFLLRAFAGQYDAEDIRKYVGGKTEVFMALNKLTPRGFYRAVAASGGWRILDFSFIERSALGRLLAYVPWVDRFMVWGISCVLQRDGDGAVSPGAFLRRRWRQDLRGVVRRSVARVRAAVGRG